MAQTNKINVYRIKDPSIPDSELVKNYQDYRPLSHPEESNNWNLEQLQIESVAYYIPIDNIGSVYVKQSREAKTRWCSSFFLDTIQLYSRSMGASLIVRITVDDAPETYAITFGHVGRFIIDPEMYDDRFGIKTALSAIDSNRLKQIVKNEFTGSNRITQQQISNGANMSGFEVNPFGDYLKSVTGDVIDSSVSKAAIKGSAALTLTLEVNIENIVATLEEIPGYIDQTLIKKTTNGLTIYTLSKIQNYHKPSLRRPSITQTKGMGQFGWLFQTWLTMIS